MPHGQPNYLNVDVNGKVSALFTGGLILPIDPNNTPGTTTTSVTWTQAEDGAWVARITGARQSISPPAQNALTAEARSPSLAHTASVNVVANNANPSNPVGWGASYVQASTETASVDIIDSKGQSSFVQITGPPRFSSTGVVSVSIGAGSVESNAVNLPIIGTTPVGCIATCNTYPGTGRVVGVQAFISGGRFQVGFELNTAFAAVTNLDFAYMQWWS